MSKVPIALFVAVLALPNTALSQPLSAWEDVQGLPPDSQVRVALRGGITETGSLVGTEGQTLVMRLERPDRVQRYQHDAVTEVSVVRMAQAFRTDGRPNPIHVRHVVRALDIDTDVKIRTTEGRRLSGRIRSISNDVFAVAVNGRPAPEQIAFGEVAQMERADHRRWLWRGIGIGAAIFVIWLLAYPAVVGET